MPARSPSLKRARDTGENPWWSFDDILGKFYQEVAPYKKPIILKEFGSMSVGGDRAQWFQQAFRSLKEKYPAVKALVFFHVANDNTTTISRSTGRSVMMKRLWRRKDSA